MTIFGHARSNASPTQTTLLAQIPQNVLPPVQTSLKCGSARVHRCGTRSPNRTQVTPLLKHLFKHIKLHQISSLTVSKQPMRSLNH